MPVDYSDPNLSHRHKGHAIEQLAEDWLSQQGADAGGTQLHPARR